MDERELQSLKAYAELVQRVGRGAAIANGLLSMGVRLDANETANLDRTFRYHEAEVYRVEYPELDSSLFIPDAVGIPEWAATVHTAIIDGKGDIKPIANFADDLPRSDVTLSEREVAVRTFGAAYTYSLEDVMRSGAPGATNLDTERAIANRDVAERKTDYIAWFGYASLGLGGFANCSGVEIMTPETNGGDTTWAAKCANGDSGVQSCIKDVADMLNSIPNDTQQTHVGTDVIMAPTLMQTLQLNRFANTGVTALQTLQGMFPRVTFSTSHRLDTASTSGAPRVIAYKKDRSVVRHLKVMPYRVFPPQARNLAWVVNGIMRSGGTDFKVPAAAKYLDGAG